jgi:hypothetical protein
VRVEPYPVKKSKPKPKSSQYENSIIDLSTNSDALNTKEIDRIFNVILNNQIITDRKDVIHAYASGEKVSAAPTKAEIALIYAFKGK